MTTTSVSYLSGDTNDSMKATADTEATAVLTTALKTPPFDVKNNTTALLHVDANANIVAGSAAIATDAANGFLYVTSCAGAPTGTPTAFTGRVPIVIDSTDLKLYAYIGGAWKSVTLA